MIGFILGKEITCNYLYSLWIRILFLYDSIIFLDDQYKKRFMNFNHVRFMMISIFLRERKIKYSHTI